MARVKSGAFTDGGVLMFSGRRLLSGLVVAVAIAVAVVLVVRFVLLGPSPVQASFTTLSIISGTVEVRDDGAGECGR